MVSLLGKLPPYYFQWKWVKGCVYVFIVIYYDYTYYKYNKYTNKQKIKKHTSTKQNINFQTKSEGKNETFKYKL